MNKDIELIDEDFDGAFEAKEAYLERLAADMLEEEYGPHLAEEDM